MSTKIPSPSTSGSTPARVTSFRSRALSVVAAAMSQLPTKCVSGDTATPLFHRPRNRIPPGSVQLGQWRGKFAGRGYHSHFAAADIAKSNRRYAHEFGAFNDFHRVQRLAG